MPQVARLGPAFWLRIPSRGLDGCGPRCQPTRWNVRARAAALPEAGASAERQPRRNTLDIGSEGEQGEGGKGDGVHYTVVLSKDLSASEDEEGEEEGAEEGAKEGAEEAEEREEPDAAEKDEQEDGQGGEGEGSGARAAAGGAGGARRAQTKGAAGAEVFTCPFDSSCLVWRSAPDGPSASARAPHPNIRILQSGIYMVLSTAHLHLMRPAEAHPPGRR